MYLVSRCLLSRFIRLNLLQFTNTSAGLPDAERAGHGHHHACQDRGAGVLKRRVVQIVQGGGENVRVPVK
jgi:hypothetical protein